MSIEESSQFHTRPPVDFDEVVEEAVLVGHLVEVKLQGGEYLFFQAIGWEIASPVGDAQGGETEAGSGDAGDKVRIQFAGRVFVGGAVQDLAAGRVGLFGEEEAGAVLKVFEEGQIIVAQQPGGSVVRCLDLLRQRERRGYEAGEKSSAQ